MTKAGPRIRISTMMRTDGGTEGMDSGDDSGSITPGKSNIAHQITRGSNLLGKYQLGWARLLMKLERGRHPILGKSSSTILIIKHLKELSDRPRKSPPVAVCRLEPVEWMRNK
jgi:hypothetical protein